MKKIAIIGASGFVGQNLIKSLLKKESYLIYAIAPDIEKIQIENPLLKKVKSDIFDYEKLYLLNRCNHKEINGLENFIYTIFFLKCGSISITIYFFQFLFSLLL